MNEFEFSFSEGFNRPSTYVMSDGSQLVGVISHLVDDDPTGYYFIPNKKMLKYDEFKKQNDQNGIKNVVTKVDISTIVHVEPLL